MLGTPCLAFSSYICLFIIYLFTYLFNNGYAYFFKHRIAAISAGTASRVSRCIRTSTAPFPHLRAEKSVTPSSGQFSELDTSDRSFAENSSNRRVNIIAAGCHLRVYCVTWPAIHWPNSRQTCHDHPCKRVDTQQISDSDSVRLGANGINQCVICVGIHSIKLTIEIVN